MPGFARKGHTASPQRGCARPPAASAMQQASHASPAAFAQSRGIFSRQSADWEGHRRMQQTPPMLDLAEAGFEQHSDGAGFGPELGLPLWNPDDWQFGSLLGSGSFGAVHEARNAVSGRVVAVKALAKSLAPGRRLPSRGTGRCVLLGGRALYQVCFFSGISHAFQSAIVKAYRRCGPHNSMPGRPPESPLVSHLSR